MIRSKPAYQNYPWEDAIDGFADSVEGGLYLLHRLPVPEALAWADHDWSGDLVFDIPRHRLYLGFDYDWPRMNTIPEWFTVEPDRQYHVQDIRAQSAKTCTGAELHEGLPVTLSAGEETLLLIKQ